MSSKITFCCDLSLVKGYLHACPHGNFFFCYGEGQRAWTTVTETKYKRLKKGESPEKVFRSKAS